MMKGKYRIEGFSLTHRKEDTPQYRELDIELLRQLPQLHQRALSGDPKDIEFYLDLIEEYPESPDLKNYLSLLYRNIGDMQKCSELNNYILAEHPGYIHARVNKAYEFYQNGNFDSMTQVLGATMQLKDLFPERTVYHYTEFINYLTCTIHYYSAKGDFLEAESRLVTLDENDPGLGFTEQAWDVILKFKAEWGS